MKWLGLLAIVFYAIHVGYQVYHGQPENVLWFCHLAAAVIGVGMLLGWPSVIAVGVLWLIPGVPLWLYDLAVTGESAPTSVLTHLGGLVIGIIGLYWLGMPAQVWWKALLAGVALQQVCRWVTPAVANVNLAHEVYPGWERWFPSYLVYLVVLLVGVGLAFFAAEHGLRRLVGHE
jgi:hypothetical protein